MQAFFDGMDDDDRDDGDEGYEARKERARKREAKQSRKGRDIGPLPEVADPARKEACRFNLRLWYETYLVERFYLGWSTDHLEAIDRLQATILQGGLAAYAMPRGNGKTVMVVGAVEWAACYGHRRFIVPIGATRDHAAGMLETIKSDLETIETIAADFPEICHPIKKLEGINNRTAGQLLNGHRTRIRWKQDKLVFPSVVTGQTDDGKPIYSPASGVVIEARGITGTIRGMQFALPNGMIQRPDIAIPDDPQTDESARRPAQTATRLNVIKQSVLGLAGPTTKIACIVPCTVIQPGDLADQLLDRNLNPEWRGQKTALLRSMPTDLRLWNKYRELRDDSLREFEDIQLATDFYSANREAMDAGAEPAWPERFEPGQISAVQYAMDKWATDEMSFWSEYQNAPKVEETAGIESLKAAELLERCNDMPRGIVPSWAVRLTAFIDVQQDVLPWCVVAWASDFTGAVIDYGCWPEQAKRYWTLRDLDKTLRDATGGNTVEEALALGLEKFTGEILERKFRCESGERELSIEWLGVDANWQLSAEIVYALARRRSRVMAYHGRFVGAAGLPMDQWRKEPGTKQGHFWRIAKDPKRGPHLQSDINSWKSIVAKRCRVERGKPGGISWFGDRPRLHELWCDQLSAEFAVAVSGRGRRVDEWKNRPGRDNHYWDCLVGSAVGNSICGAVIHGQRVATEKKRVSLKEMQEKKRRG